MFALATAIRALARYPLHANVPELARAILVHVLRRVDSVFVVVRLADAHGVRRVFPIELGTGLVVVFVSVFISVLTGEKLRSPSSSSFEPRILGPICINIAQVQCTTAVLYCFNINDKQAIGLLPRHAQRTDAVEHHLLHKGR
jgi:hypothetical protein